MDDTVDDFASLIKKHREAKDWDFKRLSDEAVIGESTLKLYEARQRPVLFETGKRLARALFGANGDEPDLSTKEAKVFLETLKEEIRTRGQSPLTLPIDSPDAKIRVLTLDYYPFCGAPELFLDRFVRKMLELAVINLESTAVKEGKGFNIAGRLKMLTSDKTDMIFNLSSLQRLRRAHYFLSPVRVSLNSVVRKDDLDGRDDLETLRKLKRFLSKGLTEGRDSWRPTTIRAIRNEVGWVYATQTLQVPEEWIKPLDTLDTTELASKMTLGSMLIADEITCLGVVKALKGEGLLVMQPATDESVFYSSTRRSLSAFPLGIAVKREENEAMTRYIGTSIQSMLALEPETTAFFYRQLYDDLVIHVSDCLRCDQYAYLGGVRRISKEDCGEFFEVLVDQAARTFAKRTLQISGTSLKNLAPELRPWRRVLFRVRDQVHIEEAVNRGRIKANLIAALKTVYGIDPIEPGLEPLKSAFRKDKESERAERWPALKYILQRDLDLELSSSGDPWQGFDLEPMVSEIQTLLESAGQTASVTVVQEFTVDTPVFDKLWQDYKPKAPPGSEKPALSEQAPAFIALNLGVPVGFLHASILQDEMRDGQPSKSLRINHLFRVEYMQGVGMVRRMVRKAIDHAHRENCRSVWASTLGLDSSVVEIFRRCGFVASTDEISTGSMVYRLDRLLGQLVTHSRPGKPDAVFKRDGVMPAQGVEAGDVH